MCDDNHLTGSNSFNEVANCVKIGWQDVLRALDQAGKQRIRDGIILHAARIAGFWKDFTILFSYAQCIKSLGFPHGHAMPNWTL